jgi:hypothetical protein
MSNYNLHFNVWDQGSNKFALDAMLAALKGKTPPKFAYCATHSKFLRYDIGVHRYFDQDSTLHGLASDCNIKKLSARETQTLINNPKTHEIISNAQNFVRYLGEDIPNPNLVVGNRSAYVTKNRMIQRTNRPRARRFEIHRTKTHITQ